MSDQVLSIKQVAERLMVTRNKARQLCQRGPKEGGLEAFKIDAHWRVRSSEVDKFVEYKIRKG
jgi:excisionase family DNA binding protein